LLVAIMSQINPVHTTPSFLPKIHFNIIHPPMSWSFQWCLSFWLSHQYPICSTLRPQLCYMPCPSDPSWLDRSNYTWRRVQVMKLFIMQLSPTSCHLISLWSKYSSQHPGFKYPQSVFLPYCQRPSFTPI
jgi:hypothetical protein